MHTALPWVVEAGSEIFSIQGRRRLLVAQVHETAMLKDEPDHREADGAFIVRAVNAHDEMLDALQAVLAWYSEDEPKVNPWPKVHSAIAKATA